MAILELRIPPHFFDSAKPENNFESVSERIARAFLSGILNIADLRQGDPEEGEPDYVANEKGYEVTFSISQSLIPQLRGVRTLDGKKRNIEQSLISDIKEAVLRKAQKNYSCVPNLVILTISTLPTWYYSLYFDTSNPCDRLAMKFGSARRDHLFRELYQNYILTNKFENIYIIQPTFDGTFAFFNIKDFGNNGDAFLTHVRSTKPKAFPTYRVVDAGNLLDVNSFEIKIVNYTFEE